MSEKVRRKYTTDQKVIYLSEGEKETYITTFLYFQKEMYYRSEGNIHENSAKDLRRSEGFAKVLYSAPIVLMVF